LNQIQHEILKQTLALFQNLLDEQLMPELSALAAKAKPTIRVADNK
jgi:hypothetical protein